MPNYRTHLVGASIAYLASVLMLSLYTKPLYYQIFWFWCSLAGGLFPDVDTKSRGQRYFYTLLLLAMSLLWMQGKLRVVAGISLCSFLPLCVKHRGLLHNVWIVGLVVAGATCWSIYMAPTWREVIIISAYCFMIGVLSHLYLDLGLRRMFRWRI